MKNLLTLILTCFVLVPLAAAQVDGDVTVNAEVVDGLSWNVTSAADFGLISAGAGTVTLTPQDGSTNAGSGPTSAGVAQIRGQAGKQVNVTVTSTDLVDGTGNTLTFTEDVHATDVLANQGSAAQFSSGNSVTLSGTGDYFFFVGGALDVPGGATVAIYSGTVTLTAAYTGN